MKELSLDSGKDDIEKFWYIVETLRIIINKWRKITWNTKELFTWDLPTNLEELREDILYFREEIEVHYKELRVKLTKSEDAQNKWWYEKWCLREEEWFIEDVMYNLKIAINNNVIDKIVEVYRKHVQTIVYWSLEENYEVVPIWDLTDEDFPLIKSPATTELATTEPV